jgi:DNA-binding protein H-NS
MMAEINSLQCNLSQSLLRDFEKDFSMARATQAHAKVAATEFDVAAYSFEELQEIKRTVDAGIEARKAHEMETLRMKVTESAQSLGVTIEELFGFQTAARPKQATKHVRGKQPAKYRGPADEEWSGKGPAPKWMKPLLAKGKKKEDFLIKP